MTNIRRFAHWLDRYTLWAFNPGPQLSYSHRGWDS